MDIKRQIEINTHRNNTTISLSNLKQNMGKKNDHVIWSTSDNGITIMLRVLKKWNYGKTLCLQHSQGVKTITVQKWNVLVTF